MTLKLENGELRVTGCRVHDGEYSRCEGILLLKRSRFGAEAVACEKGWSEGVTIGKAHYVSKTEDWTEILRKNRNNQDFAEAL